MATTYKVRYKNHCTPQEKIFSTGRYYLDSDCGRKLTGDANVGPTLPYELIEFPPYTVDTDDPVLISAQLGRFAMIRNDGDSDILLSFDEAGSLYLVVLSGGEVFASQMGTSSLLRFKIRNSGETTRVNIVFDPNPD